jgi:acyl carrier protein
VFHASGVPGGGLIELTSPESVWEEFRPKIMGALVLEEAFQDAPPDFMLFCSSLTAVVGGVGQATYCAANAFLDATAQARMNEGRRVISVNFDRWRQVGMAVQAEARLKALGLADAELDGMSRQEGEEVVHRILQGPVLPQVVTSIRNLSAVAASVNRLSLAAHSSKSPEAIKESLSPSSGMAEGKETLEEQVAALWQQLLGLERVGVEDDFFRLGGESLSALQILNRVQELYGIELSLREFYDAPTVRGLARQIRASQSAGGQTDMKIMPLPREARRLRGASV